MRYELLCSEGGIERSAIEYQPFTKSNATARVELLDFMSGAGFRPFSSNLAANANQNAATNTVLLPSQTDSTMLAGPEPGFLGLPTAMPGTGMHQAQSFWSHLKRTKQVLLQAGERLNLLRQNLYKELLKDEEIDDDIVKNILSEMKKGLPALNLKMSFQAQYPPVRF